MSDIEPRVLGAVDAYASAVLAKDVEALIAVYDPDVRVFDAWGTWSYEGAAAWRESIEGWFSSLGSETVRVTFEDVRILGVQGFASMSAIVSYAAVSAQGQVSLRRAAIFSLLASVLGRPDTAGPFT